MQSVRSRNRPTKRSHGRRKKEGRKEETGKRRGGGKRVLRETVLPTGLPLIAGHRIRDWDSGFLPERKDVHYGYSIFLFLYIVSLFLSPFSPRFLPLEGTWKVLRVKRTPKHVCLWAVERFILSLSLILFNLSLFLPMAREGHKEKDWKKRKRKNLISKNEGQRRRAS